MANKPQVLYIQWTEQPELVESRKCRRQLDSARSWPVLGG